MTFASYHQFRSLSMQFVLIFFVIEIGISSQSFFHFVTVFIQISFRYDFKKNYFSPFGPTGTNNEPQIIKEFTEEINELIFKFNSILRHFEGIIAVNVPFSESSSELSNTFSLKRRLKQGKHISFLCKI